MPAILVLTILLVCATGLAFTSTTTDHEDSTISATEVNKILKENIILGDNDLSIEKAANDVDTNGPRIKRTFGSHMMGCNTCGMQQPQQPTYVIVVKTEKRCRGPCCGGKCRRRKQHPPQCQGPCCNGGCQQRPPPPPQCNGPCCNGGCQPAPQPCNTCGGGGGSHSYSQSSAQSSSWSW